ncbi:MAG: hypothetical protein WB992_05575 [Bryobacteraceae bacterium]
MMNCTSFRRLGPACLAIAICGFAQTAPGLPPRPNPSDYSANVQTNNGTYSASLISADQVKRSFAVDISKTYRVFEVAYYPSQSGNVAIDGDDFLLKTAGNSEFIHPADSVTVASVMQQKNTPRPPSERQVAVVPSASVGYESGTDPNTGRRVHDVYTETGVSVGPNPGPDPRFPPPPGSSPYDRQVLEAQLAQRALPQGRFSVPVAGYLYFPASGIKKKSNGAYEIDYMGDDSGKVHLQVPSKSANRLR